MIHKEENVFTSFKRADTVCSVQRGMPEHESTKHAHIANKHENHDYVKTAAMSAVSRAKHTYP